MASSSTPSAVESSFTLTPNFSLAARIYGDLNATKKVLCLHGWLDNSYSFLPLAEQLYKYYNTSQLCLLTLDLPGHGHSAHYPTDTVYTVPEYSTWVMMVIEQIKWEKFEIVGHSMVSCD